MRDKKAFLNNQCKVIEENNSMEKTSDLLKKIRDTKGTFPASPLALAGGFFTPEPLGSPNQLYFYIKKRKRNKFS